MAFVIMVMSALAVVLLVFVIAFYIYLFQFVRDLPSILRRIADNLEKIEKTLDK